MLLSVCTGLTFSAQAAEPDGEYIYNLKIQTTDDADDWNVATLKLYNSNDSSIPEKAWTITSSIDDGGEAFEVSYHSEYFYNGAEAYFDFGGNIAIHHWEGTFTANLNGKEERSQGFSGTSAPFSHCKIGGGFRWDDPEISAIHVYTKDEDGNKNTDLKILQSLDSEEGVATGNIYFQMIDQYGVQMKNLKNTVSLTTSDGESAEIVEELPTECKIKLQSNKGTDYTCPVTVKKDGSEYIYYVDFVFWHKVTAAAAEHGTVTVSKEKAFVGDEVTLSATPDDGYALESVSVTDENDNDITVSDNKFTMPGSDVTVNATFAPATYVARFVADGKTVAEIPYTVNTTEIEEPDVPVKPGYTGAWKAYELAIGGVTVEAEYTLDIHNYVVTSSTPATCTEEGYDTYTCEYCGDSYNVTTTPALNHSYKVTEQVAATCETEGYDVYTCSVCGETYKKTTTPAKDHQYSATLVNVPTCAETGVMEYACANCDAVYYEEIPMTDDHLYSEEAVKPATCSEDGILRHTCEVCGRSYDTVIPSTGRHLFSAEITKDATCTEKGIITYTCSGCGVTYTEQTPAIGHSYKITATKAATCTEEGYDTYTCSSCGDTYNKTTTPALTHDWRIDKWSKDETDHWHDCTRCDEVLDKEAHTYGEVTYEWDGTYSVTASHTCTVCGYVEKETATVTSEKTKEPTCTVNGETTYTATFTNPAFETQTKVLADIPALGHDWETVWSKDAKSHWHKCTRCDEVNQKAAHTYGEKGAARYTCTVCGYLDKNRKAAADAADKKAAREQAYAEFVAGLQGTSTAKKATLKWGRVKDADSYVIYATYCGNTNKYKKIATVKGNATTYEIKKLNGKKLNPYKNVKTYVVAQKKVNGKDVTIFTSPTVHIAGAKGNYTNVKTVKNNKTAVTLNVGKLDTIKSQLVFVNKKKKAILHVAKFRYFSSNTAVATVDANGKIKAAGKGTAYIYVYSNNGFAKAIKVTVK